MSTRKNKLGRLLHKEPSPSVTRYNEYQDAQRAAELIFANLGKSFHSSYGLHYERITFEIIDGLPHAQLKVTVPGESDCLLDSGNAACGKVLAQYFGEAFLRRLTENPVTSKFRWQVDVTYEVLMTVRYGKTSISTTPIPVVMS